MNLRHRLGFAIASRRRRDLHKKLVLTYDNTRQTDGVGAQLQRIYGIYSISRLLGAAYLHSPLAHVHYQGLCALETNAVDPGFHREFNDLLHINSDISEAVDFHEIKLLNVSVETVHQLGAMFDRGETGGKPILLTLGLPYGIADRFPDCYNVCREISPFAPSPSEQRPLRIAIHIRRGDLLVVDSDRMLPNEYYVNVARHVAKLLDSMGTDYQLELHTEVPEQQFTVQPGQHWARRTLDAPVRVNPEAARLHEFDVLPRVVRCVNDRAIDCLRKLATADVLVMSKSSLSYVGGILNRAGVVLYHPFWHQPPSSWLIVRPDGQFDRARFKKALKATRSYLSELGCINSGFNRATS